MGLELPKQMLADLHSNPGVLLGVIFKFMLEIIPFREKMAFCLAKSLAVDSGHVTLYLFLSSVICKKEVVREPSGSDSKESAILWRREWLTTPVFLPREFHGQRSPAGYSP